MFGRLSYQNPSQLLQLLPGKNDSPDCIRSHISNELLRLGRSKVSKSTFKLAIKPLYFWTKGLPYGRELRQALSHITCPDDCLRLIESMVLL